ncbi:two-component system, chemotaxis family, response regulator CheY [Gracilibacillus ureilyticus]|uniref:Two-component system, chemotaxis family, response regulator CheY n=2 Tax=Gracilibacillus ureilyticus TaxID=531814 RepID=A0A1H9VKX2_9BACI|nr:two-component system, chemotaxis family, response regulator CheY [Gracilibacillus ureilyticus]
MKTVLIADDSKFMRRWLKQIIEKHPYQVIGEASNGLEAVMQFQKLRPDIILLDIIMPRANGLDALKKIIELNPNANVIIVSSLATKSNVMSALHLGAKDFIIKPFFNDLIKALDKIE